MLLDGEASELDRRLVAAHLARCAECRAFEQPVRAFTEELRAAARELPRQPVVLTRVRTGRRAWLKVAEISAAASVLIAVLGVVNQVGAPDSQGSGNRLTSANLFKSSWQPDQELAQLKASVPTRQTDRPGPLPAL